MKKTRRKVHHPGAPIFPFYVPFQFLYLIEHLIEVFDKALAPLGSERMGYAEYYATKVTDTKF